MFVIFEALFLCLSQAPFYLSLRHDKLFGIQMESTSNNNTAQDKGPDI